MRRNFIIIVLLQVLLLVGIIAYRQYWVATGERVLLGTESVDPRDIFRGDYVTLNYDISSLDLTSLGITEHFRPGERLYVVLEKNPDDTYRAASVRKTLPAGGKFIQGRVSYVGEAKSKLLGVEYDIENYFVEEGKGRTIGALRDAKSLKVEVSLRKDGKGIITGLLLDDKLIR